MQNLAITEVNGAVVIVTDEETARHIGHRLSVSSTTTFSDYREENDLDDLHRHPLAEDYNEALADALGEDC